jgi:hypothetical protein
MSKTELIKEIHDTLTSLPPKEMAFALMAIIEEVISGIGSDIFYYWLERELSKLDVSSLESLLEQMKEE